jgi:diacylglycerol kinase (ATP)
MKTAAVLFNPSSARGRALRTKKAVEYHLVSYGIEYDLFVSQSEIHLKQLAAEHVNGYPVIVAAGGDTTFNIVAAAVLDACPSPKMAMIGTGSANDIVRGLGIDSIKTSCRAIREEQERKMDVGVLRLYREDGAVLRFSFLGTLSAGLGATVNRYVDSYHQRHHRLSKLNPFNQVTAGMLGIRHSFRSGKVPLNAILHYTDAEKNQALKREIRFSLLTFLNTPYYANGLKLAPGPAAELLFDGLLDCCIFDTSSFANTLAVGMKVSSGKHLIRPEVTSIRSPAFRVQCPEPIDVQVDGDIYTAISEFHVSLVPSMLKVLA